MTAPNKRDADRPHDRTLSWALAAVPVLNFLLFAGHGLWADFSGDDLMNLHAYLQQGVLEALRGNLIYWSTNANRPLGGVAYLLTNWLFGFDPLPMRVVCFALLLANFWWTFRFVLLLTKSREAAFLATVLISYHAWLVDLYYSSGTIYELLCFFFYFSAFCYYLRIRQRGLLLRGRQWVWFILLFVCALNSKEMAVTLPLFLGIYELFYSPPRPRWSELMRWIREEGMGMVVTGLLTLPYVIGKLSGGILIENPQYQPVISPGRFLDAFHLYLNPLFYQDHYFRDPNTVQLLLAMLAFAVWQKSRPLIFAWLFLLLSVLPFIFLPHYAAFFQYIPSVGWAVYIATTIVLIRDAIIGRLGRSQPTQATGAPAASIAWRQVATTGLLVAGLALAHSKESPKTFQHFSAPQPDVRGLARQLRSELAQVPSGTRILFVNDPFPTDYSLLQLVHLLYGDLSLEIGRAKPGAVPPQDSEPYDISFDFQGGRLIRFH